jgi:hypothetical protein
MSYLLRKIVGLISRNKEEFQWLRTSAKVSRLLIVLFSVIVVIACSGIINWRSSGAIMPRVVLSKTLKKMNVIVELRGKDVESLRGLLSQKESSELVKYLRNSPYCDWPPYGEIEKYIKRLNQSNFSILLKASDVKRFKSETYLVCFPEEYNGDILKPSRAWEIHPDGFGIYDSWLPSMGPTIILTGDYQTVGKQVDDFNRAAQRRSDSLRQKVKLGEISDVAYLSKLSAIRKDTYEEVKKMALLK